MKPRGRKYFARRFRPPPPPPPPTQVMESIGQHSTFSEHGHIAYQIKENHECSNMVETILPADPPPLHRTWKLGH